MAVACSTSVLTGVDGSIQFQASGTQYCLTASDFPTGGSRVTVPSDNDFRVGDLIKFFAEGAAASIDSGLPADGIVKVTAKPDVTIIEISDPTSGAPIALVGDSAGSTREDHIAVDLADFDYVCQVKTFSLELSREELDTTTLSCGTAASSQSAPFRTMQAGYASGTGSMSVQFTDDQTSLANRLLSNSMRRTQAGAEIRLFVNTVDDGSGKVDLAKSLYIQAPVSLMGFSVSVSPDEVTVAELNFSVSGQPTHLFV